MTDSDILKLRLERQKVEEANSGCTKTPEQVQQEAIEYNKLWRERINRICKVGGSTCGLL